MGVHGLPRAAMSFHGNAAGGAMAIHDFAMGFHGIEYHGIPRTNVMALP